MSALRSAVLDPAVNLLLLKLRQELALARTRVEETQNELSAWKFTPDRLVLYIFLFYILKFNTNL